MIVNVIAPRRIVHEGELRTPVVPAQTRADRRAAVALVRRVLEGRRVLRRASQPPGAVVKRG
ncbi:MAG: hypothetical protein Q4D87_01860 [Actinomycetaceae bacterium]|nr:hypothetical protein [Actinomycetaceae bacterium]